MPRLHSSHASPPTCLYSVTLFFLEEDRCPDFVTLGSDFGLFGRVLYGFLWLADFITNDRTSLTDFAFIPPLLESQSMNMNWAGVFASLCGES